VVVGNVGWPGRINYTIVGDTVNTCQRLESMGTEADRGDAVTILVSGAIAALLGNDFTLEPAGTFQVKGKADEVEAFRLAV
jgi:adenylate cyclase